MNRFVPQSGPPRGAGDNPYSDYEAPHSGLQASMERPTPEQEAERAKFDLCKGLLDSIFAKVPEATIASHKAQPLPTGPDDIESQTKNREEYHKLGEEIEGDDPRNMTSRTFGLDINHPVYDHLRATEHDIRHFHITPDNMAGAENIPVVQIHLDKRGTHSPRLSYLQASISVDGVVSVSNMDLATPDSAFRSITDHEQKMAALDEIYDVLSFVQADLPDRASITQQSEVDDE